MPELPQELINAIVDEVSDSSLIACSLTSIVFVAPSQRRLFRQMALTDVPTYERAARLLVFSPHLGRHVRSLAVHITGVPRDFSLLKNILGYLLDVERVAIIGDSMTVNQISENPCLINLLSRPTVKCFVFEHLNGVPAALISRALSACEQVLLSYLSIAQDELVSEVYAYPGILRNFGIAGDAFRKLLSFALDPMRIGSLGQLKRLSVIFPPISNTLIPRFINLIASCARTLEYLELELDLPLHNLPALPVLKHLVIWTDAKLTQTPDILHSIVIELIAHMPNIEVITIALLARPHRSYRAQRWTDRNPAKWLDLDSVFANSPMPNLQQVEVSLRWFRAQGVSFAEFSSFMEDHLPRTVNAGMALFSHREVAYTASDGHIFGGSYLN